MHAVGPQAHAVGEPTGDDLTAGADDRIAADRGGALDEDVGIEHGVRADRDRVVHVGRGRIEDGDALGHQPVQRQPALDGGDLRELLAVVHAQRLGGITDRHALDPATRARQQLDHVGEVQLALVVVRAELAERGPQALRVEAVDAGVDLVDLLLVVGGVAILDDALDAPALPEHAAVALRSLDHRGQHGGHRTGRTMMLHEALEGLEREQRHVAGQHEDHALGGTRGLGLQDGVAGAEPLLLLDDRHVVADHRPDVVASGARRPSRPGRPSSGPGAGGRRSGGDRTCGGASSGVRERIRLPSPAARMTVVRSCTTESIIASALQALCHTQVHVKPGI